MVNVLSADKQIAIIGSLAESPSISSTERVTGAHRDTIMRLWKARHREGVPVTESHQGKIIWDGVVAVFKLTGHPKTDKAYAWMHETDDQAHPKRHVTVLRIPPVVSQRTAGQAVIIQDFNKHGEVH